MADPLGEPIAALCGALRGLRDQVQSLTTVHDAIDEFNGVFGSFQNAMALHASCLAFPTPPKPTMAPPPPRPTGIPKPQIAAVAVTADAKATSTSSGRPSDASSGPPAAAPAQSKAGGPVPKKKRPSGGASAAAAASVATTASTATAAAAGATQKKKPPTGKRPPPSKGRAATAAAAHKNARPETAPWKWDKNIRDNIPRKYQSDAELAKLENVLSYLKNRPGGVTIADLVKHSALAVIRCKEILQTLTKLNLIARRQETAGFVYTFGSEL